MNFDDTPEEAAFRAKVRAWFNALQHTQTVAKGRELVEKLLQREGRTATSLEELASKLGFDDAQALFEVIGKDEYSLRNLQRAGFEQAYEKEVFEWNA